MKLDFRKRLQMIDRYGNQILRKITDRNRTARDSRGGKLRPDLIRNT